MIKQILFKYTMYIGYVSTNEKIIIKKDYYKLIILTEDLDKSCNYYISYNFKYFSLFLSSINNSLYFFKRYCSKVGFSVAKKS